MNENNYGAPSPLDDIQYGAPTPNMGAPAGVSAPVLDDIEYVAPAPKKGGPTGVAAPVLDDMDSYTPQSQKKGAPTGVAAPVLDDNTVPYTAAPKEEPIVMTDEEIIARFTLDQLATYNGLPERNKQAVLDHMRQQLGAVAPVEAVTAPVLDEDNYTPPPKKETAPPPQPEAPITAPVLDEAPPPPKYVPKYVDEDLEKAKREAAKKAVAGQLVSDQKDSKESLRMMLELKDQLRREQAAKGFKVVILLAVIGVIGSVAFGLLYSGSLGLDYKNGLEGFANVISNSSFYIAVAMAISGLTLITGMGGFKTLTSLIYLVSGIIQLFPGIVMIPQHNGSLGLVGLLYAVSLICTVAVFVGLSAIESVGLFFNKKLRE